MIIAALSTYSNLLLKDLLNVMTTLEDVTRCYVQCIYIKKENIKLLLTGLFCSIYFCGFVAFWFC